MSQEGPSPARRALAPGPLGFRVSEWLVAKLGSQTLFLILLAALLGVASGYGAILFRKLIALVSQVARPGGATLEALRTLPLWQVMLPLPIAGLIVGPLVYYLAREARGAGVPEVMDAVSNKGGRIRRRVALVKSVASAVSIGAGVSLGSEGPIVQIGGSIGSSIGQALKLDAKSLRLLVACGVAGGIAAIFNAPIAGALFALEVVVGVGSIRTFTPLVVSTVVATMISRFHLGDFPAFAVPRYHLVSGWELPLYALLGALAAVAGVGFARGVFKLEDWVDKLKIHEALRPAVGGVVIGLVIYFFPDVAGAGYETIEAVLGAEPAYGMGLLLALALVKIAATHISLAFGFSGGVFAPLLFLGTALGGAFGMACLALFPEGTIGSSGAYALVGMGGVVAAATHTPLTVILMVFEMTGDYHMILPLMLATTVASVLSQRLSRDSIYTMKLLRRGARTKRSGRDQVMYDLTARSQLRSTGATVRASHRFGDLIAVALENQGRPIYVTDDAGSLRGVISLEDVSNLIRDEDVLEDLLVAADVMRMVTCTALPDDNLARCLKLLGQHPIPELPITEPDGRLIGVVSRTDILSIYDREVLQRDGDSMAFVDASGPASQPLAVVQLPAGGWLERIEVNGPLVGMTLRSLHLRARYNVNVQGVQHPGDGSLTFLDPDEPLRKGDILMVVGSPEQIAVVRALTET